MPNPFLHLDNVVDYTKIKDTDLEPAIDVLLQQHQALVAQVVQNPDISYQNVIHPLEDVAQKIHSVWALASHLNNVVNHKAFRSAYNRVLPKITTYMTELAQNEALYHIYEKISNHKNFALLTEAQQKIITNALRDFKLAGVALPQAKKNEFLAIEKKLAELCHSFEENLLDATDSWSMLTQDVKQLAGLPHRVLVEAAQKAQEKNTTGYCLTLEFPCYHAVLHHAHNRELRHTVYKAYATRASELSDQLKYDNTELMEQILDLRLQKAKLLNFTNFCELSLATKDAGSPKDVLDFLHNLVQKTMPKAKLEYQQIAQYAKDKDGITQLEAWDIGYYSEMFKHEQLTISDEIIRPFFPITKVTEGLFKIVETLYGVHIQDATDTKKLWHKDAKFYEIYQNDQLIAGFYFDLYARAKKRGGAWMDNYYDRHRFCDGKLQLPVAFLTCNFTKAHDHHPALLNHEEVLTLFHEFGHGLHHMLTHIEDAPVSGVNGVAWDVIEFPSQFMENFCWDEHTIPIISAHYQTGKPMPAEVLRRLQQSRHFQAALHMAKQLEFSLFDMELHLKQEKQSAKEIQSVLDEIRKTTSIIPVPSFNRFQHGFSHVFGGSYAAGYYSYKWAEVLAADAFEPFLQHGVLNEKIGKKFLDTVLALGGSKNMMDMYVDFRGHKPNIDVMLKHYGLS